MHRYQGMKGEAKVVVENLPGATSSRSFSDFSLISTTKAGQLNIQCANHVR